MRVFKLKNEYGQEYLLDRSGGVFLYKPSGLGRQMAVTSQHTVSGFYPASQLVPGQPTVSGEIVFSVNPYTKYRELLNFISAAQELSLGYAPNGSDWYFLRGVFSDMRKSEIARGGVLRVQFVFKGSRPWARENPITLQLGTANQPLSYDKTYDYTYGDDSASGTLVFTAQGDFPAAIELEHTGALTSPVVQLQRVSDESVIGKLDLTGYTFPSGAKMSFSTVPGEAGIFRIYAGAETDLINQVNILDNNFFTLPIGIPCRLTMTASGNISSTVTVRVYEYYGSV